MITRKFLTADELVYLWENRTRYPLRVFAQKFGCHPQTVGYKLNDLKEILVHNRAIKQSRYKAMSKAVQRIIERAMNRNKAIIAEKLAKEKVELPRLGEKYLEVSKEGNKLTVKTKELTVEVTFNQ